MKNSFPPVFYIMGFRLWSGMEFFAAPKNGITENHITENYITENLCYREFMLQKIRKKQLKSQQNLL